MSALERSEWAFVVGAIGVGAALLIWRPHWGYPWFLVTYGVGFGAQRWVLWKPVMIVAVMVMLVGLSFTLTVASPWKEDPRYGLSALGLAAGAGIGIGRARQKRAIG